MIGGARRRRPSASGSGSEAPTYRAGPSLDRRIHRAGVVILLLFLMLFINLNYYQVIRAEDLATDNRNARHIIGRYAQPRGEIRSADGVVLARHEDIGGELVRIRRYDTGPLFAHPVGFLSFYFGAVGLEESQTERLLGTSEESAFASAANLFDYLFGEPEPGSVRLTLDSRVQEAARAALGDQRGAVVALDPTTGAVYALWSNPSYDPNPVASHGFEEAGGAFRALDEGDKPGLARAYAETYAPGSTFKIVVAAAALAEGVRPEDAFPNPQVLELPDTTVGLRNFGGGFCRADAGDGVSLRGGFIQSCNTTFAQIGLRIGGDALRRQSDLFGLDRTVPGVEVGMEVSHFPIPDRLENSQASVAQSAIGQFDVRVTPLQMAMVAAGVANNGLVMRPYLVAEAFDGKGRRTFEARPELHSVAMEAGHAQTLKEFMVATVAGGTGTAGQVPGVSVGGKTGTAETAEGEAPHAWFVSFAPAENPRVAVAVVVENGGDLGSEATGGQVAAPVAREVIQAVLREP